MLLLLDRTGSMHEIWPLATAIAQNVVADAPLNVSLAMVSYSQSKFDAVKFSHTARNDISERFIQYSKPEGLPYGKGSLAAGIRVALNELQPYQIGDAILLISDGEDVDVAVGDADREVLKKLSASGVRLFSILITDPHVATIEVSSPLKIQALAQKSGGASFVAVRPFQLPAPKLVEQARMFTASLLSDRGYQLSIHLSTPLKKPTGWILQPLQPNGKMSKDIVIWYPRVLQPCANQ